MQGGESFPTRSDQWSTANTLIGRRRSRPRPVRKLNRTAKPVSISMGERVRELVPQRTTRPSRPRETLKRVLFWSGACSPSPRPLPSPPTLIMTSMNAMLLVGFGRSECRVMSISRKESNTLRGLSRNETEERRHYQSAMRARYRRIYHGRTTHRHTIEGGPHQLTIKKLLTLRSVVSQERRFGLEMTMQLYNDHYETIRR